MFVPLSLIKAPVCKLPKLPDIDGRHLGVLGSRSRSLSSSTAMSNDFLCPAPPAPYPRAVRHSLPSRGDALYCTLSIPSVLAGPRSATVGISGSSDTLRPGLGR